MALIDSDVRSAVAAIAALTDCNPFVPERIELERRILGAAFVPIGAVWNADGDAEVSDPNLPRLRERVEQLVGALRNRLAAGAAASAEEIAVYRGAVFYLARELIPARLPVGDQPAGQRFDGLVVRGLERRELDLLRVQARLGVFDLALGVGVTAVRLGERVQPSRHRLGVHDLGRGQDGSARLEPRVGRLRGLTGVHSLLLSSV